MLAANRSAGAAGAPALLTASIRPSGLFGEGDAQLTRHMVDLYFQGRSNIQVGGNENLFDFTYVRNAAHAHLLAALALLATHTVMARAGGGGEGGADGAAAGAPGAATAATAMPLDFERVDGEAFLITNDSPVYFWDFARAMWAAAARATTKTTAAGGGRGRGRGRRPAPWVLPRGLGLALGRLSEAACAVVGRPPTLNRQRIVYSCMTRYYDISKAKRRLGYRPIVGLAEGVRRAVAWALERGDERTGTGTEKSKS